MSSEPHGRRVLLVSGPVAGGMKRHLEALATGLPRHGYEVAVATPAMVELEPLTAWFPFELGDRPRPLSDLAALGALGAATREWGAEVVHAHGVKAALAALTQALPGQARVVVTVHNLWHGGPLTLPLRCLMPRSAALIGVSDAVAHRLKEYGIRHRRLVVIPNGVDLDRFGPSPLMSPDRPFTVAFVGRLTEEKGVPVLLEAVRDLPPDPEIQVLVAGDGPLRPSVERAAERSGGRLSYLGPQPSVAPVYHGADAVVMPSLSEGHPMTALEAMACGLPVVASRVGGLAEIVVDGETGLLLPPGDGAAVAKALVALVRDPEMRWRMGAAGRRRVEAGFTQARMLERVAAVYDEVLAGRSRPA